MGVALSKSKLGRSIVLLCILLAITTLPSINYTKAQPRTITVPDDYQTIQEAIDNAIDGDTIFVKKGTYYNQSLIVNKSISLIGEDPKTTILQGPNIEYIKTKRVPNNKPDFTLLNSKTSINFLPAITIVFQVEANDVTITGFTITNAFTGITGNGNGTNITGNIIRGSNNGLSVSGFYKTIAHNNITGSIHGIQFSGSFSSITGNNIAPSMAGIDLSGSSNTVSENSIIGSNGHGIEVNGDSNTISNNNITDDSTGITLRTGLGNIVSGNNITENWSTGIWIYQSSNNIVYKNFIANNVKDYAGFGISLTGLNHNAENNTLYHNTLVNNTHHFRTEAPYFVNYWDNSYEGNYWDNYNGTDSDGNGIGDTSYIIAEGNVDDFPLMFPYDVETDSIIKPPPEVEPFPTTIVIVSVSIVVIVGIIIAVFVFGIAKLLAKKRKTSQ